MDKRGRFSYPNSKEPEVADPMNASQYAKIPARFEFGLRIFILTLICLSGGDRAWAAPAETSAPTSVQAAPALAADPAWERFAAARRVFQIRLCDMATQRWPQNRKFFEAHRDLQLAYVERRNLVFYHLQNSDPSRIVRDKGGEAFVNFAWTPEEDAAFSKNIKGFAGLTSEIERLKKQSDRLGRSKELRDRFERLEIDPEYLALMRETTRSIGEAERLLAGK